MGMDRATIDYLTHRERTERERAERSFDPAVARVHRELADLYAARLADAARPADADPP